MTREQRSKTMSRIRSRWTSQEIAIHETLGSIGVVHEMHPKIPGNPDLVVPGQQLAVYLHGCFWHKCPKCFRVPKTNQDYWMPKLDKNVRRDAENLIKLRESGWSVVVLWEHEIKKLTQNSLRNLLRQKGILVEFKQ